MASFVWILGRSLIPKIEKTFPFLRINCSDNIPNLGGNAVVHSEIRRLEKIEGVGRGLGERIDGLDKRLDVVQRLPVVEAKLKGIRTGEALSLVEKLRLPDWSRRIQPIEARLLGFPCPPVAIPGSVDLEYVRLQLARALAHETAIAFFHRSRQRAASAC